jgi:hypothetical protein
MKRDERGVVAGLEGLVFSMLILFGGTILVVDAWAVIDTRVALDGAAREYLRAYTEAPDPATAASSGDTALRDAMADRPGLRAALRVEAPNPTRFGPCSEADVVLTATVPSIRIPYVGDFGTTAVRVRHSELVDAHREVINGAAYDPSTTPCW